VVALLQRLHARAHVDDDAGALVAEDHREQALRVGARARELVGVADARGLDLDSTSPAFGPVEVEIDTSDPRPQDHPPSADVAILLAPEPPPGLKSHLLFALELAAVASPAVAQQIDEAGPSIFQEVPLIVQRARPESWRDWALQAGFRVPEPKQVVELDTMFAVARAAERGVGIALVPWILLDAWFEDGDLVRVSPALLATEDRYFLTVRPEDEQRPEVQAVVQWALREFRRAGA
jgi:LysR family transcriptional regulator, glycine cleavage system transcriptional activator